MQFFIILHFRFFEVLQFQEFWETQILNSCSFHNFTIQIFWSFAISRILKIVRYCNSSNLTNPKISRFFKTQFVDLCIFHNFTIQIFWNFAISRILKIVRFCNSSNLTNPKISRFFKTQIVDLCSFHNFTIQIFWSFAISKILKIVRFYNLTNPEISKLALILWNFRILAMQKTKNFMHVFENPNFWFMQFS